ncbi:MAG: hypothetical protein IIY82_03870 [Firmicutes bacterium]|nr:hypothetical protein [Bacillota bacterium]MCR4712410.1 hypothetical protein [Clostridia bacterium]
MKKIKLVEEKEVKGLFGRKKTVQTISTVKVDNKTYKRIMKERRDKPFTMDEMCLFDMLDDED